MPKAKKILIVEDDKATTKALELKLLQHGYEVEDCSNGEEALNLLDKKEFDLAIVDLVMPRLDGYGLLKEIQKMNLDTDILVLTNYGQEGDEKELTEIGADKYFIKSNTPLSEVVAEIDKMLKS